MFVTHGHCATPFKGTVDKLKVSLDQSSYFGSGSNAMEMAFEINPKSFVGPETQVTDRVTTSSMFMDEDNPKMVFKSTNTFKMGEDWYQINGKLSIKGIDKDVKFFATKVVNSEDPKSGLLVLEGQFNILDWGIDYDKIIYGESSSVPTQWMHINMKIDLAEAAKPSFSVIDYFN